MGRKPSEKGFVDVAVLAAIQHPLTYRVPKSMEVLPGQRVVAPLGNRKAIGVVLGRVEHLPPGVKARELLRILDPEPVLPPELLLLGKRIQEYYLAPIGEVLSAMLPLRSETRRARVLELTEGGRRRLEELETSLFDETRKSHEAALLRYLAEHTGAALEVVRRKFLGTSAGVSRALSEGWARVSQVEKERRGRQTWSVGLLAASATGSLSGRRPPRLSPAAERILEVLREQGPVDDHRRLLKTARGTFDQLRKLRQAGLIELNLAVGAAARPPLPGPVASEAPPTLTEAQAGVLDELTRRLRSSEFSAVLLQGVTGSGKTEVYLQLITCCLEAGRTALMLVPEIALTPAVRTQFAARFGERVAVLHSGLSEAHRHEEWWRVRRGDARVVLGTRSAVFAPLENLGVVIVDEEHDTSYKQEETPRYHGRDVAVLRARLANALAVLGSATPSLESAWNARQGKYARCLLEERIGRRPLARVEIVDMRQEFRETHSQVPISRRLKEELEAQLRGRAQSMVLLNRRGWSWFQLCRSCGQTQRCRNCSISLTYHRRERRLICHYCGYSTAVPTTCPACGSEHLYYVGEGTEKLERKLAELFPTARVERLDRDVAQRPASFHKILSDFSRGRIDILVGTQMIAKGHDFPGVTLVGVVSADAGLSLPDFRAAERTFQLLTQAAGRAGRGEAPGRVVVQTFYPEHYAIRLAAEQDYEGFFAREMNFRRMMHYPPCTALANLLAQDPVLERAAGVARQLGTFLSAAEKKGDGIKVLGPSPAPLAKLEGRYRIQFVLKSSSRARLNAVLRGVLVECERRGVAARSVMVDVDPVSLM